MTRHRSVFAKSGIRLIVEYFIPAWSCNISMTLVFDTFITAEVRRSSMIYDVLSMRPSFWNLLSIAVAMVWLIAYFLSYLSLLLLRYSGSFFDLERRRWTKVGLILNCSAVSSTDIKSFLTHLIISINWDWARSLSLNSLLCLYLKRL